MSKNTITLIAIDPIRRNGHRHKPGASFECDDVDDATHLVAIGAARQPEGPAPADEGDDADRASWAARVAAINAAIDNMEAEDPDHAVETLWKKDGHPRKGAVAKRVDFDLSHEDLFGALTIRSEEAKKSTSDE